MSSIWPEKTLADLCEIARGGSPRPIKQFLTEAADGINWIKISDATASSKYIYSTKQKIKPDGVRRSRMVKEGDFLLSNSMSFGRPYIMRTSGCIHDGWLVLGNISASLNQDYLYHFLSSPAAYKQFDERAAGSTVRNLNIDLVRSVQVPLPSLQDQVRIVSILDEAFAGIETAIANTEKNLANARELFESFTLAIFSNKDRNWISATLKDVCATKITDGTHQTPKYFKSGYIFLSSRNVTSRKIDWDNVKYVDEAQHDEFQKRMSPKVNDILLAKNGTTGVAALVNKDVVFDIYVSLALLRPSDKVLPCFLLHFVNSPIAGSQFKKRLKGIGVPNLHLREIRDVQIHYPSSILDQERICNEIDEILNETQRLENIYKRKLSALTELKQSLLQRAFSGELTADKLESEANQAIA